MNFVDTDFGGRKITECGLISLLMQLRTIHMRANKMKKDKEMGTKSPHPIPAQKKGKGKAIENAEKFALEERHS